MATHRLFAATSPPTTPAADYSAVNTGVEFYVNVAGCSVTQIHFWKANTGDASDRTVALYQITGPTTGTLLASQTLTVAGTGWQTATLTTPVALTSGTRYRAAVRHPFGEYAATPAYFTTGDTNVAGPLFLAGTTSAASNDQGSFKYGALAMPDDSFNAGNYWTDVTIDTGAVLPSEGSGVGSWSFAGAGSGAAPAAGTGGGASAWVGSGSGSSPTSGGGIGLLAWAGVGTGRRNSRGSGVGLLSWSGIGSGPALPVRDVTVRSITDKSRTVSAAERGRTVTIKET